MTEFQTHLMYRPIHYLIAQITFPEYHPTPWHYPLIKETTDQLKFALVLCQMNNDDHCPCTFEFCALHAVIITFKEIRSDCDFQIILLDLWDDWEPKRGGHFEDLSSAAYIEAGGNSHWSHPYGNSTTWTLDVFFLPLFSLFLQKHFFQVFLLSVWNESTNSVNYR